MKSKEIPIYELPRDELIVYKPDLPLPADLESFWSATLDESRAAGGAPEFREVNSGLALVDTFDVTYSGFGGHPVRAWLHIPAGSSTPLATVVRFIGYGGGRGLAHEVSPWVLAGYACLTVDTRGQGSAWSPGDTPDPVGGGPAYPGFLTRGILDREQFYYRRVYTDAVLAVEMARRHALVRSDRVAVTGASQGGGIALAVAGLSPDVWAAMPDVPFLCAFPRALEVVETDPYIELSHYLGVHRDQSGAVFSTLAYFDAATLGRAAKAPALFSVALKDQICPPSTVYAAYNLYAGPKHIVEYPFNDHEGGQGFQQAEQFRWLASLLRGA